jgi:hypothetical protein
MSKHKPLFKKGDILYQEWAMEPDKKLHIVDVVRDPDGSHYVIKYYWNGRKPGWKFELQKIWIFDRMFKRGEGLSKERVN